MPNAVSFKFDSSELNRELVRLSVLSDKAPADIVNRKSFFIFRDAEKNMKAVEAQTIKDELGAEAASFQLLTRLKSGRYSRSKKNLRTFFGQGAGKDEDFPLLAAIIQARARKSGKPSPWKGKDRQAGAAAMQEAMQKVFSSRQSARGYFKKGFANLRYLFKRATKATGNTTPPEGKSDHIANGTIARGNRAIATFFVKSTDHDKNDALDKYASPVLQAAFDREASSTAEHVDELEFKDAIKALGIKVT